MFDKSSCFEWGYITKAKGLKGELVAFMDTDHPESYTTLESVLVENKANKELIPFFILSIQIQGSYATLSLEGVESREAAEDMTGSKLYLPESLLPVLKGDRFYYHEIIGFDVFDQNRQPIGPVQAVIDLPGNELFEIKHKGKEVLVPISDGIIQKVDKKNRQLHLFIPDGLLEIYTDEN